MELPAGCDDVPELLKKEFEALDPNSPSFLDLLSFRRTCSQFTYRANEEMKLYHDFPKRFEGSYRQKEYLTTCCNQIEKLWEIVNVTLMHGICFSCRCKDIPLIVDYTNGYRPKELVEKYDFSLSYIKAAISKVRKLSFQPCSIEYPTNPNGRAS
jgi:hypothetical protein